MCDKANEVDSESMHSDDSCTSTLATLKETLENLINKSMKDFGAHHDLELRNSLLKLEEENVTLSCRHLQRQIKKRNERLEEFHEKFINFLKKNRTELEKQLSTIQTDLENINKLFSTAFEKYSSNFERNVINQSHKEIEEQEKKLKRLTNEINALQHMEQMTDSLIQSQANERTGMDQVTKLPSDLLLKRPNTKLEEEYNTVTKTIKQLEARANVLKSFLKSIK